MKKYYFAIFILQIVSSLSFAQLPKAATGRPEVFDVFQNETKIEGVLASAKYYKAGKIKSYWNVYSDRVSNITYDKPDGTKKAELGFMDYVIVAEINNNWLHVYTETYEQVWPAISATAKDLGWIKIDNLVLSSYCLATNSKFTHKAMVLTDISTLENGTNISSSKEFFYNPELAVSSKNVARTFEIYFVFKETDKAVLLSKTDIIKGSSDEVKGSMLGWMSKKSVTFWDHRICMELNWDSSAYKEYNNLPICVFGKQQQADSFFQNGAPDKAIRKRFLEAKRESGLIMRSPVLEHQGNLKKIGTIGNMTAIEEKELARLQGKLQDVNDKIENINILFVIDGTESMKKFYTPVTKGISASISHLKAKYTKNRFKFGAVIYRDYKDKVPYEIQRLTSDYNQVTSFLSQAECYSNNARNSSAVYNGLINGLNDAGFQERYSNFIILIGDAGNPNPDPKGKTMAKVTELMSKYQVSMVGFQVNNGSGFTYEDFIDNIRGMVKETACDLAKVKFSNCDMIRWDQLNNNSFKLRFKNTDEKSEQEDLLTAGRINFPSKNASLPVDILEKSVEGTIDEYDTRVNKQKTILENTLNRPSGDFTPAFEVWLINQGFSAMDIQRLKTLGSIRVEGWTADRISGKKNPCYLPVAFLSRTEFYTLVETCKNLNYTQTKSDKRKSFQQALIKESQTVLGDQSRNAVEIIEKMSLNDVWQLLFGIPFYDQEIGKIKIKNITTRSVFSDTNLDKFTDRFKNKLNRLQKYINTQYPYSFQSNDEMYYWFPMDELP
jgi:hypothetical protein